MSIPILNKEDVVQEKHGDDTNTDIESKNTMVDSSVAKDDERQIATADSEENVDDIRKKVVDLMKNNGYVYVEGENEFKDETNDMFTKGGTLVELSITIGIDKEVIKQFMEDMS